MATVIADAIDSAALASATMSRYCPPSTSVRISAHTRMHPPPRVGRQGGLADLRDDVVGPGLRHVTEQDGRRHPELVRRAPPVPVAVQRREAHVGRRPAAAGGGDNR